MNAARVRRYNPVTKREAGRPRLRDRRPPWKCRPHQRLRRAALSRQDGVVDGVAATYRQYRPREPAQRAAVAGHSQGRPGAILSPNSHFFLEAYYGVTQIGAILVPLNYRLIAEDHEYIINHSGVKAVLVVHEYTAMVDGIRPDLRTVEHWIVAGDGAEAPGGWTSWEELIAGQPTTSTPHVEQGENDTTSINYTSGTTARPKGVMLTHRNCYINAYNFIAHLGVRHEDVELWTLPMFHANGWGGPFAITAVGATRGAASVSGPDIYRLIEQEKVTFACMAPAVLSAILNYADKDRTRSRLARVTVAGAPPPAAFILWLGWAGVHPSTADGGGADSHGLAAGLSPGQRLRAAGAGLCRGVGVNIRWTTRGSQRRGTAFRRRGRRPLECGAQGLLEPARGNGQGDLRRLVPQRRPRSLGRVRQHPHRRPEEGRHHLGRREHLIAGDRGRALQAPGGARMRRHRRAQREVGRDAESADRAARSVSDGG